MSHSVFKVGEGDATFEIFDNNGVAEIRVGGTKVAGAQEAAIPNPAGGATVDAEARTAIIAILDAMRAQGSIAT